MRYTILLVVITCISIGQARRVDAQVAPDSPPAAETSAAPDNTLARPAGFSFGIGLGIEAPSSSLLAPSIASARLRLLSRLALEPRVVMRTEKLAPPFGDSVRITSYELALTARYTIATRGAYDLVGIAGGAISRQRRNPLGPDNNESEVVVSALWGVGVERWFGPHWSLSASARSDAIRWIDHNAQSDDDQRAHSYQLSFAPTFDMQLHIYF